MKTVKQIDLTELTPHLLGNRETIRENTQRGEEIVKIELEKLVIRDSFNVRKEYGDLQELANSILENGQTLPGRVDVLVDGRFVITDGHRRFKALKLLQEQGHEPLFMAIVNKSKTSEEQRIIQMFTTQDNKPLLPHEVAELIQKLINLGHSQKSVAVKIGKSTSYVNQMLDFSTESSSVKNQVLQGNISVSTVVRLKKAIPNQTERSQKITEAISGQEKKKKVSVKEVTKKDPKTEKAQLILDKIKSQLLTRMPSELLSESFLDKLFEVIYNNL